MASELVAICDGLENDDRPRRQKYLQNLRLYELRSLTGLNASGYGTLNEVEDLTLPILRALCDTMQAEIAGRQRPLPMFLTSGADWKTRRRAKRLGKFVEAVLHQAQGTYVNSWELMNETFLDLCIYDTGVAFPYVDDGKVVVERVNADEILVDSREGESGTPLNIFRSYVYDEDQLLREFIGADDDEQTQTLLRSAIASAAATDVTLDVQTHGYTRIARSVKVREGFRLPLSDDLPGKHAFAIPGKLLSQEEWTRDHPYVIMRWSRQRRGFWGTSLIDEAKKLAAELNRNFARMQARMNLLSNRRTWVPRGANVADEEIEANEYENICYYDGAQPPVESEIPALSQSDVQFHEIVKALCYEMPGVPRMASTGQKEPGLTAGVALRLVADLPARRFAPKARYAYEYGFVTLARKIVAAVAEWTKATGQDITVRLPRKRGMQDINWTDVRLDCDFEIQIAPVSSLPSDPAGRMAMINDLFSANIITPATFRRLLDWPDLEQEGKREQSEWEYVEDMIDRYLDAEEDDEEFRYEQPDGFITRKPQALLQVSAAYFEAKRDGAPDFNLGLLRRYMKQLGQLIARAEAPPAPPAASPAMGSPVADLPPAPGAPDAMSGAPPMLPMAAA